MLIDTFVLIIFTFHVVLCDNILTKFNYGQFDLQFDSGISKATNFVQKLQADTTDNSIRGPYLANLEIERRKKLFGKNNEDALVDALLLYYSRYVRTVISYF